MKVSVIIPVYNVAEQYLKRCIETVLSQTVSDIEVIIINDGATDGSDRICNEYALVDNRVRVVHQENQGVSVCRNKGIDEATGDWIAFVDSDDWIENDYLEKMIDAGEHHNADIVISDCYVEYSSKTDIIHFYKQDYLNSDDVGKDRFVLQFLCSKLYGDGDNATDSGAPWGKLYNRKFIVDNNLIFDIRLKRMQDNVFNMYAFEMSEKIIYFKNPLYHYRKSSSSGFQRYIPEIAEYYKIVFDEINYYIKRYNKSEKFIDALNYKIITSVYPIAKMNFFHKDNPLSYADRKKNFTDMISSEYYSNAVLYVKMDLLSALEKVLLIISKHKLFLFLGISLKCKNVLFKMTGRGV